MALSGSVTAAVLFAALLHACWNALVKSSADKSLDTALIHLLGSLFGFPLLLWVGVPPPLAWPFVAMSVVIHIAYYAALAGAYKHGDLGLSYPLMRGIGPVLVALGSVVCLGESLSVMSWMGVFCVCLGGLMLGLSPLALQQPTAIRFALVNACVIACYTVVDALGARAAVQAGGSALQYVALLFVLDGWPFAMLVLKRRGLCVAWVYARARAPLASFGAIASLGSYSIALWAMTKAPVATVAALRETSVVFAALLGSCLLKEALTVQRAMAILITLAGVIALRVG